VRRQLLSTYKSIIMDLSSVSYGEGVGVIEPSQCPVFQCPSASDRPTVILNTTHLNVLLTISSPHHPLHPMFTNTNTNGQIERSENLTIAGDDDDVDDDE
jgi:hypothetical protein